MWLKRLVLMGVLMGTMAWQAGDASACTCLPADLKATYNHSTDVIEARVLFGTFWGSTRYYLAHVRRVYKGCLERGDLVWVSTARDSAGCGVRLGRGHYLLTGESVYAGYRSMLSISLCGYNRRMTELSDEEQSWLGERQVCCGDHCTCADGSEPVLCEVDPCSVVSCPAANTCVANYCGGCNAEFYDAHGYEVCAACEATSDCAPGEQCVANQCVVVCTEDAQCAAMGGYCALIYSPTDGRCLPWRQVGERCGDKYGYHRCDPTLTCVVPDPTDPYMGVCMQP
jgi:hypothetical protein